MENVIGIDLGGTSIEGGKVVDGLIVQTVKMPTRSSEGGEVSLSVLKEVISALADQDTRAVGIGVPSVVDRSRGIVYNVQNIAGWDEVHLKEILESEFSIPVYIDNDANCFAFGEKIFGAGSAFDEFVGVTLGTGVGAGIVQGSKLLRDANCGSGEFGELPYLQGKLEDYCASRFFVNEFGITGEELAISAAAGDEKALEGFALLGRHLSYLVKTIVFVLDPQAIVFGGSIAKSFPFFEKAIWENLSDFPYPKSIEKLRILPSGLRSAGVLGAASLCFASNDR